MRPKLLQSFLIVVGFWLLATTLYWSLQKPEVNFQALLALAAFAQKIGLGFLIDATTYDPSILGSFSVQKTVLLKWSLPVLMMAGLSFLAGGALTWFGSFQKDKERTVREKGSGVFRGVKLTVGKLPAPRMFPRDEVELSAADNEVLASLSEKELVVLNQIMGTISANESLAPELPNGASLVSHTLGQLSKLFKETHEGPFEHIGLTVLTVAALQLGYLTAYVKGPGGKWVANGNKKHPSEAAFILSGLPAWFELEPLQRDALYLAVKFTEKPMSLPDLEGDTSVYPVAVVLIGQTAAYGAVPLNQPKPQASPKVQEEKVVTFKDFDGPSALAQEDAAYTLPSSLSMDADIEDASAPGMVPAKEEHSTKPAAPIKPAPGPAPVAKPVVPAKPVEPQARNDLKAARAEDSPKVAPVAELPVAIAPKAADFASPKQSPAPVAPAGGAPGERAISSGEGKGSRAPMQMIAASDEDVEKIIFDTFIRLLPSMAFQHKGLPRGVKAVAWKLQSRVYMIEIKLRESILAELPESLRQSIMAVKDKNRVHPLTRYLFQIFHKKGWLVTEIDGMTVSPHEASWNVHAGTLDFQGVMILDFPEEFVPQLPVHNSMYKLRVTRPLYTSSASGYKKPDGQKGQPKAEANSGKPSQGRPVNSQGAKKANQTSLDELAAVLGPNK